eukprot:5229822-Prymnesium_polylepis.2
MSLVRYNNRPNSLRAGPAARASPLYHGELRKWTWSWTVERPLDGCAVSVACVVRHVAPLVALETRCSGHLYRP